MTSKSKRILAVALLLIALAVAVVSFIYLKEAALPADVDAANTAIGKFKKTVNPGQFRAWAVDELGKRSATNGQNIPDTEVPDYIKTIASNPPNEAYFFRNNGGEGIVFEWGGPFFDWAIMVGQTNLALHSTSENTVERWVPGIYFERYDR